jgi:uncharacterized protein YndB with AHSA1/START domain
VDKGFVAVAPGKVFEVLASPGAYPRWWPGARAGDGDELRLPGVGRVGLRGQDARPGVELVLRLEGRRHGGRLQWYLEPFKEGTVVYGIVDLETERRWTARRARRVRAGVRGALVALKETLE